MTSACADSPAVRIDQKPALDHCAPESVPYAHRMTAPTTDSALMLRYRDGDIAAFETLYRRHNDSLFRYLLRMTRNRAAAEDVYQEVWARLIKARQNYRRTAKFSTYLYRIAHNCFIDSLRRNRRYDGGAPDAALNATDPGPSPEHDAECAGLRTRMMAALDELPTEQRDVFMLHEEAGLGLDDIAHVTGAKRETVKSRLRYANRKLRSVLSAGDDTVSHALAGDPQ